MIVSGGQRKGDGNSLFISKVLIKHISMQSIRAKYEVLCKKEKYTKNPKVVDKSKIYTYGSLYERDSETSRLNIELINDGTGDCGQDKCIIMRLSSPHVEDSECVV